MRRILLRCVPEWDLRDLYIITGLGPYDLQDMYDLQDLHDLQDPCDLPEWNLCDLNYLYILPGMWSARFAGSVLSAAFLYDLEGL